ncbi:MAG TPA: ATP-binding cassette domain-containing protein [Gemmataceae bacterium]|nr:ATP-binding cassette domain-containing protein [Gemmataceae bacterium]
MTKYYGDYPAVRDVSFTIPKGQIVGFLGPNGAGKSTTMRILAGYLAATSGSASIDGIDVFWNPVAARRRIGYMPENCPLYPEMRVREYLHFRAGIKGLHGAKRKQRIDYVLGRCWLTDVDRQLIGTLSKGYRQRVGLADTLLADPAVLILDEPTSGLDPAQIRETRTLIHELGKEHTLILSTHILPEVEMTCNRVIIIHQGRVAESRMLDDLESQAGAPIHDVIAEGPIDDTPLRGLPHVTEIETTRTGGRTHLRIHTTSIDGFLPELSKTASARGWVLREVRPRKQSLEDLFVRITSENPPAAKREVAVTA